MNRKLVSLAAAALVLGSTATVALAQQPAASARSTTGPTVSASVAGIRPAVSTSSKTATPPADARLGAGRNVALMVVGGAALIIGAIIGGTAGVLIAVTGAAIGLYGLYHFVQ